MRSAALLLAAAVAVQAQLKPGIDALEDRHFAEAIRLLAAGRSKQPAIADYYAYYLAAARAGAEDFAGARKELAAVDALS
ncbi:MAG: hypothetical protein ACRD96_23150, partial [Bryobacteraceae bacterium]